MFDKKSISKSSREFLEDTGHTILDLFNQEMAFIIFEKKSLKKNFFWKKWKNRRKQNLQATS